MTPRQKPGRSRQCYRTPPEFLEAVRRDFEAGFVVDLAATSSNRVCRDYYGPDSPLGKDSLAQVWPQISGDCWCNPPFADILPWVCKGANYARAVAANDAKTTINRIFMLLPASVGTEWFCDHVDGQAHVVFVRPRLTFVGCADPYPKDLMLAVYGVRGGYSCWRWK